MTTPALIITILSVAALVGLTIVPLILAINKIHYPDGDRYTCTVGKGFKVTVVFGLGVTQEYDRKHVTEMCAMAAWSLHGVWQRERRADIKQVVVMFRTKDTFMSGRYKDLYANHAAAYISSCRKGFRKSLPMPVIQEKYIPQVIMRGEPVMHELCHALLGQKFISPGGQHKEEDVWANFGKDTYQAKAQRVFSRAKINLT